MKNQLKTVFKNRKFMIGFIIFIIMLLTPIIYPLFNNADPLEGVGGLFYKPGTYVNIAESIEKYASSSNPYQLKYDTTSVKVTKNVTPEEETAMRDWLMKFGTDKISNADVEAIEEKADLIKTWLKYYDRSIKMPGVKNATKNMYNRLQNKLKNILNSTGYLVTQENVETGEADEVAKIRMDHYINIKDIANSKTFILGTDNFGRDVLVELIAAIGTSIKVGFIAGSIATLIGLTLGLLAGYLGGFVDNFIIFITNLFTVIPGFIILVLISSSIGQAARSMELVAFVIGLTSWPWTTRSVRAQTISLRNRDHVNLSKLSGHSLSRIIITDILPYLASYVVMAFILQISSGILAEAQLSMLGIGPSASNVATLGSMMNWATQYSAPAQGAWWAYYPIIFSIAFISFSLNFMNTGLDQVFNPQLRD